MARSSDYDSASSQFFIVQDTSDSLDGQYAAFGNVTSGMEVVDAMAKVPTGRRPPHDDVPKEDIVLTKAFEEKA